METLGPPRPARVHPVTAGEPSRVQPVTAGGPPRVRPRTRQNGVAVRLTARGAASGLFACSFAAMLLVDWTGWTAFGDFVFIAGCGGAAYLTKRGSLLAVAVTPPMIYFLAVLTAALVTASGTFTVLSGLFITLGTSAPWLFLGTGLAVGIATFRGLPDEVADFVADLRGLWRGLG